VAAKFELLGRWIRLEPTERFSGRAEGYAKYRPGYPGEVLGLLEERCGFDRVWIVADVGSGTGNLARLFLENGNAVYGVEPNEEMRGAGERALASYERFVSLAGTAEATTLPDGSVDLVSAGQAFHWFDRERTREEFRRILKPGGWRWCGTSGGRWGVRSWRSTSV
jgi:SAM-dependent methyltransferase